MRIVENMTTNDKEEGEGEGEEWTSAIDTAEKSLFIMRKSPNTHAQTQPYNPSQAHTQEMYALGIIHIASG